MVGSVFAITGFKSAKTTHFLKCDQWFLEKMNKLASRPKKVLTQVSILASMCENVGYLTDSSRAENPDYDSNEHD